MMWGQNGCRGYTVLVQENSVGAVVWARINNFPRLRGKFFRDGGCTGCTGCTVCTVCTVGSIYIVGFVYTTCTVYTVWPVWLVDDVGTVYTVWTQGQQSICYSYSREWMIGPLNPTDYRVGRKINVTGAAWTWFSGRNGKSTVSPC